MFIGLKLTDMVMMSNFNSLIICSILGYMYASRNVLTSAHLDIIQIDLVLNWKDVNDDYISRHLQITNALG